MLNQPRDWSRIEAEMRIGEVFNDAKLGRRQRIFDSNGVFEVTFRARAGKTPVGEVLARGGPDED